MYTYNIILQIFHSLSTDLELSHVFNPIKGCSVSEVPIGGCSDSFCWFKGVSEVMNRRGTVFEIHVQKVFSNKSSLLDMIFLSVSYLKFSYFDMSSSILDCLNIPILIETNSLHFNIK